MSETPLIELKNVTMMFKVGGGIFSKPSFIKAVDNVSLATVSYTHLTLPTTERV